MRRVRVFNHVSLDGVMQAPASPDEDTTGGFKHGGWANENTDEVMGRVIGEHMARGGADGALLFGRRTYEHFYAVWPNRTGDPFSDVLNRAQKYVASTTLREPLPWQNSTLLPGDAADAIAELKAADGGYLTILGSGHLIHSLVRRKLIDEFTLLIHPVILGEGLRIFPGDTYVQLRLTESTPTTKGVIIATYELAGA